MNRNSVAAKVAANKERHPEKYCPAKRCLWRTGGGYCQRHKKKEIKAAVDRAIKQALANGLAFEVTPGEFVRTEPSDFCECGRLRGNCTGGFSKNRNTLHSDK